MLLRRVLYTCFYAIVLLALPGNAQLITSSATVRLSGPVNKEATEQGRAIAASKMKAELVLWLQENLNLTLDTTNLLDNYNFDRFAAIAIRKVKEESSFKGPNWTISYSLLPSTVNEILTQYNSDNDSSAVKYKQLCASNLVTLDYTSAYFNGVKALAFASAHLGPPAQSPGMPGRDLIDDIRSTVQDLFNKIKIVASEMVIKGKAGQIPENPARLTITLDSIPLGGISMTAVLPSGRELFTLISSDKGEIALNQMKVPFVANGTFLNLCLDLGKAIGASRLIEAKDFGLQLNNSQDQTFIFKLTKPTFTLDYKAAAVSKLQLPADFLSDVMIRKFLRDSCYLEPSSGTQPPDLAINMTSQVSNYSYDETEETAVKVISTIVIKGNTLNPAKSEQEEMTYEKRYDRNVDIPLGLFFWETNNKLRITLKSLLEKL